MTQQETESGYVSQQVGIVEAQCHTQYQINYHHEEYHYQWRFDAVAALQAFFLLWYRLVVYFCILLLFVIIAVGFFDQEHCSFLFIVYFINCFRHHHHEYISKN